MPSTPQHSIAFEPCQIGPIPNPGTQTKLGSMGPSLQPDHDPVRTHVEDPDFPMAPALPKIRNNNERSVAKRTNSAGGGPPKLTSATKTPGKEKRKAVSVGGSPKKVPPANGGGPVKSKLVGWGSKKVTPIGSPTKLETDGYGPKITDAGGDNSEKAVLEGDMSLPKAPPDVWIPKHSPSVDSPGTLEELVDEPIFLDLDKKQKHLQLTHSNNLLDEELITEELRMDERVEKNDVMEVGLYMVRREAMSKGELGGWQWTRTGFNPDPGLSVVKGTHHREYLVSSRVHGAEIMVSRTHNDFSQLHRALQTRLRGNLECSKYKISGSGIGG